MKTVQLLRATEREPTAEERMEDVLRCLISDAVGGNGPLEGRIRALAEDAKRALGWLRFERMQRGQAQVGTVLVD